MNKVWLSFIVFMVGSSSFGSEEPITLFKDYRVGREGGTIIYDKNPNGGYLSTGRFEGGLINISQEKLTEFKMKAQKDAKVECLVTYSEPECEKIQSSEISSVNVNFEWATATVFIRVTFAPVPN